MTTAHASVGPISSIVVGTDFTPCSAVALGQAMRISAWTNAKIQVTHIIDTTVVIEVESALSPMQQNICDSLMKEAEGAWAGFSKGVPGAAGLPIHISIDSRIVGILRCAKESKADLIVLGAFGDRTPDVGFGTVATACVRSSNTDVLLVRDTKTGPFKTIVAAVDFSETSMRALQRAADFAARDGAELHVLHVFTAPWNQLHFGVPAPLDQPHLQMQYRDSLERRLTEFAQPALEARPGLRSRLSLHDYSGHRSGIVEYAKNESADLIVLGTRGRTNMRDFLLGSTAEKALKESGCSILAVKPAGIEHLSSGGDEPRKA